MTREEAKVILKGFMENPLFSDIPKVYRAFDMAIKALEQEPCEDCISREAVDEYITNLLSGYLYDEERTRLEDLTAFVWELPSVTPKPKTGHWILLANELYMCSECNAKWTMRLNYCPNCGAKMIEPQESEDKK